MVRLRLLGGFELILSDGSTPRRLGSKPQGLLAFLAMSRGATVARGRLVGLLWGERDEDRARHSLNQALTTVRTVLGPADAAVLQSSSDGVRLVPDSIDFDVGGFESAARSHQQATLEEACKLYRGEFLEGVESSEPGFEDWLLSERYRLGELAADAFARLLEFKIGAGDVDAAIATARRLVAIAPLDEPTHARLVELYAAAGRRGLAEAHYERVSNLLRRELGQAPGEELRAAIAAARRRSPARSVRDTLGETRPNSQASDDRPRSANGRTKAGWVAASAGGAMLLLLAGVLALHGNGIGYFGTTDENRVVTWDLPADPSIAVLPFEDISDFSERSLFAKGLTDEIITSLSKFSGLFVIASDTSSRYSSGTEKVRTVARDLRVRYVLKGSVQSRDDILSIDTKLIDATTGHYIWAEHYERPAENFFAIQKEITQTIVAVVGSDRGEIQRAEIARIRRVPTKDLRAYGLYVRGVEFKGRETREANASAREMFEKALAIDPNYARAMAANSLTYIYDLFQGWTDSREEWLQRAEEFARRAIATDSSEPWGFVALAVVYQAKARNDEAISLFEAAHRLNPNDYYINMALGYAVTFAGSAERGIELLEKAERLNPYHTEEPSALVWAYFFAHRYQDALATIRRITRRRTETYWIYKAAVHAQLDQMGEAQAAVAEALKLRPELTVQSEHENRLALGLAPEYAAHLSIALRKARLPD